MKKGNIELIQGDCMDVMRQYEDNYFDLAIVDPPYGINASEMTMGSGKNKKYTKGKEWDTKAPNLEYFVELERVSKNQIVWGGNYFLLPISRAWIFWDKGINGDCSFADGELAWTSFDRVLRKAKIRYKGFLGADNVRIHPTQKPVSLYDWIYKDYAEKGQKILDTHLGSGSNAIAAHYFGVSEFVGIELDKDYFKDACKRVDEQTNQLKMF